ncbi:hypothetical protein ATO11_20455 [Pseudaestuariivita atlantica]|uniref:Uncharacterized protein n=1 Tax=Pseudaestuariivita atlantica TaxID=1317121 RepID=A0A0L1JKC5_9RHOB|nr:hypothetical protein ATO11_20455 [Pseudaestuariivita atlantica]
MISVLRDHLARDRRFALSKTQIRLLQNNYIRVHSVDNIQYPTRVSALVETSCFADVVTCYAQVLWFHLFDIGKRFRNFINHEVGTSGN